MTSDSTTSSVASGWRSRAGLRRAVRNRAQVAVVVLVAITVAGFLGPLYFAFELASHFVVFYAIATLPLLAVLIVLRAWRWALLALAMLTLNTVRVITWYVGAPANEDENFTLLAVNVLASNHAYDKAVAAIAREAADIVLIQEFTPAWAEALEPLHEQYPHRIEIPQNDNFGIALFSRLPFVEREELVFDSTNVLDSTVTDVNVEYRVSSVRVRVDVLGTAVELLGIHTLPPVDSGYAAWRNLMMTGAANWARKQTGPTVVLGDLNTTMWSPVYRRFERESGLRNAREGFGILSTWPAMYAPCMIPIDHCLVSDDIGVVDCATRESIKSDHMPLRIALHIPPAK